MTGGAVVAAVAAKLNAALDPTVYDGATSRQNASYEQKWASIGDPWDDDQEPVVTERVETGATARRRLDYQISCLAYSSSGGDDISVCRNEAAQMVADVDAALAADRTLGGQVARVRLGDVDRWDEGQDTQGVGVRIGFTIEATVLP